METRANYIAVGAFTLAAIAAVFIIIFWFGKFSNGENRVPINVRIQGSVSGLGKGSAVQFNGITVGQVKGLSLDTSDPRFVIVHAELDLNTPVREDTKATIGIRGLSGGAFISLEGGDKDSKTLLLEAPEDGTERPIPVIQGDPAALADLLTRVNEIASRTERVMGALEKMVESNQSTVNNTLGNVEVFSKALAANSDGVGKFMESAGNVAIAMERMTNQLDGSAKRVEAILSAVDPQKVSDTVTNIKDFSQAVADQRQQVNAVMTGAATVMVQLNTSAVELSRVIDKVDKVVNAVDAGEVKSAISNLSKSAQRAEQALAALDSEKLNAAVSDIADTASDVRAVIGAVKPEAVSGLVNDVSAAGKKVSTLISSIDPSGVNAAVKRFENAAAQAETVLAAIDSTKIGQAVDSFTAAGASAEKALSGIEPAAINAMISDLGEASKDASQLMKALNPDSINQAVENISKAAAGAQGVVSDVRNVTSSLGKRGGDINQMVTDASQMVARLNASSAKIDNVVSQVDQLLGSGGGSGLANEAQKTLLEIRRAARSLSQSVDRVANNVDSFTRRGLGDVQGLVSDARRSVESIDRVMRNIGDNPSSLLTGSGGSKIRETSGGRPRR